MPPELRATPNGSGKPTRPRPPPVPGSARKTRATAAAEAREYEQQQKNDDNNVASASRHLDARPAGKEKDGEEQQPKPTQMPSYMAMQKDQDDASEAVKRSEAGQGDKEVSKRPVAEKEKQRESKEPQKENDESTGSAAVEERYQKKTISHAFENKNGLRDIPQGRTHTAKQGSSRNGKQSSSSSSTSDRILPDERNTTSEMEVEPERPPSRSPSSFPTARKSSESHFDKPNRDVLPKSNEARSSSKSITTHASTLSIDDSKQMALNIPYVSLPSFSLFDASLKFSATSAGAGTWLNPSITAVKETVCEMPMKELRVYELI